MAFASASIRVSAGTICSAGSPRCGRASAAAARGDQSSVFHLINSVSIKGGYAGLAAVVPDTPDDRDFVRFETILSGDLGEDDIPGDFNTNRGDNSYYVIRGSQPNGAILNTSAVLEGVTISGGQGGYNDGSTFLGCGAGIFLPPSSSPTVLNCRFLDNSASATGGGMYCSNSCQPVLTSCAFERNFAKHGAGMYISSSVAPSPPTSPSFTLCTFSRNATEGNGAGVYFGGSRAQGSLDRCVFEYNQADYGAAVAITDNSVFSNIGPIKGCRFVGNVSLSGGGAVLNGNRWSFSFVSCHFLGNKVRSGGGGAVMNSYFNSGTDSTQFVNCVFSRNEAKGNAGAIFNNSSSPNNVAITNCSFSKNTALFLNHGGGVYGASQTTMVVRNCLFWDNLR